MKTEEFLKKIEEVNAEKLSEIKEIIALADKIYGDNKCNWGEPRLAHCLNVATACLSYNLDLNAVKLAILHDIGVFTDINLIKVDPKVKALAKNYTTVKSIAHRVKDAKTTISLTTKLLLSTSDDIRILIVKLFDKQEDLKNYEKLPNVEKERLRNRIKKIYSPLADFIGMGALKREFDDTVFSKENPTLYKFLKNYLKKYSTSKYAKALKKKIIDVLAAQALRPIKVFGRAKGLYSTYEKLIRYFEKEITDSKIPTYLLENEHLGDKYGLTIILNTEAECFQAFALIKKMFEKVDPLSDDSERDYITNPRPNGYRGLQIRIFTDKTQNMQAEIQIRTPKMHLVNEHGQASHIAWKVKIVHKEDLDKDLYVFDELQKWKSNLNDKSLYKLDLFKDSIFVFTPKSDVIRLSKGSTPIDFAYKIHTEIGDTCQGAKINGIMSKLSDKLKTGDVVEIITGKRKNVRETWLKLARDTSTLSQIRKSLREN